jgi:peptidoglycan/xylan/chitin deacetylase (PgdA/CDA1 family)
MSVRYLVRFDDICPTLDWGVWQKLENVMIEENVSPILSVIPDNQDQTLREGEPDVRYWDRVRSWQARGWTIALHGYQHRYVTHDAGIIGLNNYSEFAGLPLDEQRTKLQKGLEIFAREGVRADAWVAPAHSFDANTIKALVSLGVRTISDGMSLYPHRDSQGVIWVPQQLWRFRTVPFGVWTVCIHPKDELYSNSEHFRRCVREYKQSLTNLPAVAAAYADRRLSWSDDVFARLWRFAIHFKSRLAKRLAPSHDSMAAMETDSATSHGLKAAR